MVHVGIIGGGKTTDEDTMELLSLFCQKDGKEVQRRSFYGKDCALNLDNQKNSREMDIVCMADNRDKLAFDLLIINGGHINVPLYAALVNNNGILLINGDDKNIFRFLNGIRLKLITFGFNSKTSVTASSVTENNVQICIQRDLPSFTGEVLEQREFLVCKPPEIKNVHSVLSSVIAALITGVRIN